jgi:hypothetical protein
MPRAPPSLFAGISTAPQSDLEPGPDIPPPAAAAAAVTAKTLPADNTYEADVHPSRDASRDTSSSDSHRPRTARQQIAIDCCSRKDLSSLSNEQLLQLCQTLAVENKALNTGMQWLAASRDAAILSSKEEAACQAAVIARMQADHASQAAAISCLKKQALDLQQQLGSAQYEAGKWKASFASAEDPGRVKVRSASRGV